MLKLAPQIYSGSAIGGNNCSTFAGNALQEYWNNEYLPILMPSLERQRLNLIYLSSKFMNNPLIKNYQFYKGN